MSDGVTLLRTAAAGAAQAAGAFPCDPTAVMAASAESALAADWLVLR